MAYTLQEIDETISGSGQDMTITRNLMIQPYSAVGEALSDALGGYRLIGGTIQQILPVRHPVFTWCRCTGFNAQKLTQPYGQSPMVGGGVAALERVIEAKKAMLSLTYTMPSLAEGTLESNGAGDNPQQELELASEAWDFSGKELELNTDYYVFASDNQPLKGKEKKIFITVPEVTLQLTRHKCFRVPFNTISTLMNSINLAPFQLGFNKPTFPSETVRFEGLSAARKLTTGQGLEFFEVSYKFAILPVYGPLFGDTDFVGWNRTYYPEKGYWDYYVHASTGEKPYKYADELLPLGTSGGVPTLGLGWLFDPRAF